MPRASRERPGNTVTVTFSQGAAFPDIRVLEYSNVDPTNPFDGRATRVGERGDGEQRERDDDGGPEVLVGAGMTQGAFSGAGSGYSKRIITNPDGDIAEDRVVATAGSYSATAPVSGAWLMQLAAFKGAGSAPAPTSTASNTATATSTASNTPTATNTANTPTATNTVSVAPPRPRRRTPQQPPTRPTATGTATPTNTAGSATATGTATSTPSQTPTKTPTPRTPAYVQGTSTDPQTAPSSVAVGYGQAQTAGDLNVVVVGWNDTTATIKTVTDSAGNSYQVAAPLGRANGMSQAIYYAKAIAGAASNTVTVTFSQGAAFPDIRVLEYSNVDPSSPFDGSATGSGSAATASSGNLTTTGDRRCWWERG